METMPISVGFELEANVIEKDTGKAVLDFNNTQFLSYKNFISSKGFFNLQKEFDAATLEIGSFPYFNLNQAFSNLLECFQTLNHQLSKKGLLLLLMGLHPGRYPNDLIATEELKDIKLCIADKYSPAFYCGCELLAAKATSFQY